MRRQENRRIGQYSHLLALLSLAAAILYPFGVRAEETFEVKAKTPVVIELFTSQGCSSCPAADKFFEQLAGQENVIALSCHVSYWNLGSWTDTLSQDFCDIRQHGLASLDNPPKIYTPQMIMNGMNPFIGSRPDDIKSAISAARNQEVQPIAITRNEKILRYELPEAAIKTPKGFRLWMYGYKKSVSEDIKAGENGGLKVHYVNAAVTYDNLGPWEGDPITSAAIVPQEDVDGVVIFAQAGGYGRIVAAGKIEF
ncbi:MAG: DUF1223 domain-containing protein [Alphaproteobacteria bacterium]|nr:DUF1223 domain-containing protein [Alphaproteobacteria bacterium]MBP7761325.1 DUF1223 domain-containing protein [Alphaproteobacteria bacterium]MBP7905716.1 DUF1223 domain-containing protein [Alphaproteobacteria bacterium]